MNAVSAAIDRRRGGYISQSVMLQEETACSSAISCSVPQCEEQRNESTTEDTEDT
jgi:hypothetical protein